MAFPVRKFVQHVVPGVLRPLRILWNQIIGFVFLAFALLPVPRTIQAWREFEQNGSGLFSLLLSAAFIAIMAGFGLGSFLRARKISRS
jgi:hypothetical protein